MRTQFPRPIRHALALILSVLVIGGCGSDGGGGPDDPEWVQLIGRSWTVASGNEAVLCRRIQATSDWYITGFRSVLPPGHTRLIVTTSASGGSTGDFPCDFGTSLADTRMIYSAGVGTGQIVFPDDVGIRVNSGDYVTLLIQVNNQTAGELSGTTTVSARQSSADDVTLNADMTFAGNVNISIPDNGLEATLTGGCTATQAYTIFALLPALKELGTHVKVTVTTSGVPNVIHDEAFSVASQPFVTITPGASVAAGSTIAVAASWINNSGDVVTYGFDTVNEWAFAGVYRYPAPAPAAGAVLGCVN